MNQSALPSVEIIQGGRAPEIGAPNRRAPRRILTFVTVFLLITAVGMAWNYSREERYRTAATVLTVKPKALDARSADADFEHVAIQGRALMDATLLAQVANDVSGQLPGADIDVAGLEMILAWQPVEQTNLIELSAEGPRPAVLKAAVNAWASTYEAQRKADIAAAKGSTMVELEEQQTSLRANIQERQAALAEFRQANDIVSLQRADNRAPAELKGLNAALNKARERLVDVTSKRSAMKLAIDQGKAVMPPESRKKFRAMQLEVAKARARLDKLEERFTASYIERDPTLRDLPSKIAELDNDIELMRELGRQQAFERAEQQYNTAQAAFSDLEQRLKQLQSGAMTFAGVFSEHEALEREVAKLQRIHADNAERLAQLEARNVKRYPPVQVVAQAPLPRQPISPNFARDARYVLGGALVVALFATWLLEYLTSQRHEETTPLTGVRIYSGAGGDTSALSRDQHAALVASAPPAVLPAPDEDTLLEVSERATLLASADEETAAILALLLSGVAPHEIEYLDTGAFVAEQRRLLISEPSVRDVELSSSAWQRLEA
jgi:succinoglycan biosynthesis transport protein ExoP